VAEAGVDAPLGLAVVPPVPPEPVALGLLEPPLEPPHEPRHAATSSAAQHLNTPRQEVR
jgi:hypothetical protein